MRLWLGRRTLNTKTLDSDPLTYCRTIGKFILFIRCSCSLVCMNNFIDSGGNLCKSSVRTLKAGTR